MHLVAPLIHSHFKLFDAQFHRLYFPPRSASVAFYLDGPGHLLTVILAPGGADTDCQRDVSFLLFISSLPERCLRTQVSLFSPEGEGGWGEGGCWREQWGVGVEGPGVWPDLLRWAVTCGSSPSDHPQVWHSLLIHFRFPLLRHSRGLGGWLFMHVVYVQTGLHRIYD